MKHLFTIICLFIVEASFAQWSNTTNSFTNALQMPVITATGTQQYAMRINSYPDGGYIVFGKMSATHQPTKKIYTHRSMIRMVISCGAQTENL